MEAKKISFGFSKVAKKPNILPAKAPKEENKVELIKCLEGKEIKLVAERHEDAPLIIQMATNQKTSTALASLMKRRAVLLGEDDAEPEETTEEPQSIADLTANSADNSNLEQRAARELLAAVQNNGTETVEGEKLVLPALKADELPLDGAKESTIDDYDSIPIQQFGLAMLRGMGWKDPPPKKKGVAPVDDAPFMRPKGMGLGADKALKAKALLVQPERNEVLEIKKQAYVRILGGKLKDQYGQIEGFDDHAGRVIVKLAIGGAKEAFNEFLCQPVSRKEYAQYGKCINTAKYEEFKKQENEHGQIIVKREKSTERKDNVKTERRDRQREEEHRGYRTKDEDRTHRSRDDNYSKPYRSRDEERKPFKSEQRSMKMEDRRADYKEERRQDERKAYKTEERRRDDAGSSSSRHRGQDSRSNSCTSKSSSRRRQQSTSDEAEDTGESTESDSDSAYERKDKKKSKSSSKSKKKSKKAKSKSQRHRHSSDSQEDSDDSREERSRHRHTSKHKKKTKKSKHARSRTRSRSREGRGR